MEWFKCLASSKAIYKKEKRLKRNKKRLLTLHWPRQPHKAANSLGPVLGKFSQINTCNDTKKVKVKDIVADEKNQGILPLPNLNWSKKLIKERTKIQFYLEVKNIGIQKLSLNSSSILKQTTIQDPIFLVHSMVKHVKISSHGSWIKPINPIQKMKVEIYDKKLTSNGPIYW